LTKLNPDDEQAEKRRLDNLGKQEIKIVRNFSLPSLPSSTTNSKSKRAGNPTT